MDFCEFWYGFVLGTCIYALKFSTCEKWFWIIYDVMRYNLNFIHGIQFVNWSQDCKVNWMVLWCKGLVCKWYEWLYNMTLVYAWKYHGLEILWNAFESVYGMEFESWL